MITAAILFAGVAWRTRSPWRGFVAFAAWASAYELAFNWTGALLGRWSILRAIGYFGMLGWVLLALWMGHRPNRPWLAAFVALWALWIVLGFHANAHGRPPFSGLQEALNVATKAALGLAYLIGGMGVWTVRGGVGVEARRLKAASSALARVGNGLRGRSSGGPGD